VNVAPKIQSHVCINPSVDLDVKRGGGTLAVDFSTAADEGRIVLVDKPANVIATSGHYFAHRPKLSMPACDFHRPRCPRDACVLPVDLDDQVVGLFVNGTASAKMSAIKFICDATVSARPNPIAILDGENRTVVGRAEDVEPTPPAKSGRIQHWFEQ